MLKKRWPRGLVLWGLVLLCLLAGGYSLTRQLAALPDEIYLIGGGSRVLDVGLPMSMTLQDTVEESGEPSGITVNGSPVSQDGGVRSALEVTGSTEGQASVELKLFGMIPIKEMRIISVPQKVLVPGGQTFPGKTAKRSVRLSRRDCARATFCWNMMGW